MLMMLTLIGLPMQIYVASRIASATHNLTGWQKKRVYLLTGAVGLWLLLYPVIMLGPWFNGIARTFQHRDLLRDLFVTYPFWLSLILALELCAIFLLIDASRLILLPLYRKHKVKWRKVQAWIMLAAFTSATVYGSARIYNDTFTLRVKQGELLIENLPRELDGLRIVQLADMQADGRTNGSLLQRYVDTVNSLNADLILFGGDMVTSGTDYIDIGAQKLGEMRSTYGSYACLGDHDFFSDRHWVTRSLSSNGVKVLDNASAIIQLGSHNISLTGVTNVYRTRPEASQLRSLEERRPVGTVNIMLTHQPSTWLVDLAHRNDYDLFVAGHTHGGQVAFPLPGYLLAGSSFETDYVTGFYKVGDMHVSVTNGLGLTLAPIRYHAPAEVTVIVLRSTPPVE